MVLVISIGISCAYCIGIWYWYMYCSKNDSIIYLWCVSFLPLNLNCYIAGPKTSEHKYSQEISTSTPYSSQILPPDDIFGKILAYIFPILSKNWSEQSALLLSPELFLTPFHFSHPPTADQIQHIQRCPRAQPALPHLQDSPVSPQTEEIISFRAPLC